MSLPVGLATVSVGCGPYVDAVGTPYAGRLVFTPSVALVHAATGAVILPGAVVAVLDATGSASVVLPATDTDDLTVVGHTYTVEFDLRTNDGTRGTRAAFAFQLPQAAPTVDLDLLAPTETGSGVSVALPAVLSVAGLSGTVDGAALLAALGAATDAEVAAAVAALASTVATDAELAAAVALLAPKASPTLTGTVTVPTAAPGDNTTKAASTAFVGAALTAYAPRAYPSSLAPGVALANQFDPQLGVYNLKQSNTRRARAAFARQRNGESPMRLSVIGNSIAYGTTASPAFSGGFVSKLRTALDAKYGAAGTGIVYPIDTALADDTRIVESGAWSILSNVGAFNVGCRTSSTLTNTWSFGAVTCDSFTFYLIAGGTTSNTLTLAIDGGAAQTFTSPAGGEVLWKITKSAGSLGSHTCVLTVTGGQIYVIGVEGTIGSTSGIRVSRCAKGGTYLGVQAASNNFDTIKAGRYDSMTTGFDMSTPDLTVLFFETNEYLQQVPLADYLTGLTSVVNRARQTGDIMLCTTVPPQNTALTIPLSSYTATIYAAADALDVPVIDVTDRWASYAVSNAAPYSIYGDGNHPNTRGHWDLADQILAALSPVLV